MTSCTYSPDAALIAGGKLATVAIFAMADDSMGLACTDGALHLWQTQSNFVRPHRSIEGAHVKGTETGSLVFSLDGHTVMTRGGPGDDTLKRKYVPFQL